MATPGNYGLTPELCQTLRAQLAALPAAPRTVAEILDAMTDEQRTAWLTAWFPDATPEQHAVIVARLRMPPVAVSVSEMLGREVERLADEYRDAIADAVTTGLRAGLDAALQEHPDPAVTVAECFRCGRATGFPEWIGTPCRAAECPGRYIKT